MYHYINTQKKGISLSLNIKIDKFKNWINAIFISPNIFYALPHAYVKTITKNNIEYSVFN